MFCGVSFGVCLVLIHVSACLCWCCLQEKMLQELPFGVAQYARAYHFGSNAVPLLN